MLYDSDIQLLKKYRHIVAALIQESLGYFTPKMALDAINAHKTRTPYACEWYWHIAEQRLYGAPTPLKIDFDNTLIQVNHDIIKSAVRRRARRFHCLKIVDANINGYESIGASWF